MGAVADAALDAGGKVIGIMPTFMRDVEWAHRRADMHFVGDMHERKKKLLDRSDGVVALPGGTGTLEELLEAITLKKLGLVTCPIVIVSVDGYYDPLVAMLDRCIDQGFMNKVHRNLYTVVATAEEVLPALRNAPEWDPDSIKYAAVPAADADAAAAPADADTDKTMRQRTK
jgi:uncharacterized protein (TIGR00730 family)